MKRRFLISFAILPALLCSCSPANTLDGYDNSNPDVFNTNLFYKNVGQIQAADPHVVTSNGKYYLYATNANDNGDCSYLQCWSSENLTNWTNEGYCYQPNRNHWCLDGLWAPEVIERNGMFYLYYCGWNLRSAIHEIGVARSSSPTGPFVDFVGYNDNGDYISEKEAPIHINLDGGANDAVIDASPFIDDDGRAYLYFVQDQHTDYSSGAHISTIYAAELNSDMVSIKNSSITKLAAPSLDWEKESGTGSMWNEAPFVYKQDGMYYLFYSANYYMDRAYCIGCATSLSPMGPFTKIEEPILKTKDYWDYVTGTGHCSIFPSADGKETFIAYHSHVDTVIGGSVRKINFDRILINEKLVHVNGPSISPQLLPSGTGEFGNIANDASIAVNGTDTGKLNDGFINPFEDYLEDELVLSVKKADVKVSFDSKRKIRAVMVYDSAALDHTIPKVDRISINGLCAYDVKIAKTYFDDEDSNLKIPCSAFIYEFDEIESDEIEIALSSRRNISLNEIVVVGK